MVSTQRNTAWHRALSVLGCGLVTGVLTVTALLAVSGPVDAAATARPRLVIIAAGARTSKELIDQALQAGYDVVGVARHPEDVTRKDPHLTVLKGDVYDRASLDAAMAGHEVVVSMVSPRVNPMDQSETPPTFDLFTTGTRNIIDAMQKKGNKRLLVASSLGVEDPFPTEQPDPKNIRLNWLWKSRYLYKNMADMEGVVRKSGLEFVIFRPAFLVEEPARNDLRFSVNTNSPKGSMLTYADFAAFVLAQAQSNQYLGDSVGIYTDRELKFGQNVDFEKLKKEAAEKARRANAL